MSYCFFLIHRQKMFRACKGEQRRPQRNELGAIMNQTTGTLNEHVETYERGHEGGRGHCGYGPRAHGEEEEDKEPL